MQPREADRTAQHAQPDSGGGASDAGSDGLQADAAGAESGDELLQGACVASLSALQAGALRRRGHGASTPAQHADAGSVRGGERGSGAPPANKKRARLTWTAELHTRFLNAVHHLGVNAAVPKAVLQLMNVEGMTRENVASHLQKYRLHLRRCVPELPAHEPLPDDILARASSFAPFGWGATSAGVEAAARSATKHRDAAAAPPAAAQHAAEPPAPLSAAQLASLVSSEQYASLFALGAGVRMPSGSHLAAFVAGETDSLARPRERTPPSPNKPPAA